MPNIAKVLKDEIQRLAKKQIKEPVGQLRKEHIALKRTVADLRKRLDQLERTNRQLVAAEEKRRKRKAAVTPDDVPALRITAKGIRSLRRKLNLSQADFARLVGVSSLTVYQWEHKEGRLTFRGQTPAALASIRDIGAREARRRLEAMAEETKDSGKKKTTRKSKKKSAKAKTRKTR